MNEISIPVFMSMALVLYIGVFHIWMFFKLFKERFQLSFGLLCFVFGMLNFCTAMLYSAPSFKEVVFWQKGQVIFIPLAIPSIFLFIHDLLEIKRRWLLYVFAVICVFTIPITILTDLSVDDSVSVTKEIPWLGVSFVEAKVGDVLNLIFLTFIGAMGYLLYLLLNRYKQNKQITFPIIVSIILYYIVALNDILIANEVYSFIYLNEYGILVIAIGMAKGIMNNFVILKNDVEILNVGLERKVEERTALLKEAQKLLVDKAHKAGRADVAGNIMHNIGNTLNSIITSAKLIDNGLRQSKLGGMARANELLRNNIDDIERFISTDPRGKKLLRYYLSIEDTLKNENLKLVEWSDRLLNKIDSIQEIVQEQEKYVSVQYYTEEVDPAELVDYSLKEQEDVLVRNRIEIEKNYQKVTIINIQRTKLVEVISELIKNAIDSLAEIKSYHRKIDLAIYSAEENLYIEISDNGKGVAKNELTKIFSSGFTRKEGRHGRGLHNCANYMTEMGGGIRAESRDRDAGVKFILTLPIT